MNPCFDKIEMNLEFILALRLVRRTREVINGDNESPLSDNRVTNVLRRDIE